jgi:type II restriction/modification system DNA methylase subunit YeeA
MRTIVSQMTPEELVEFALMRKRCFEQLRSKLSELSDQPDNLRVLIAENGNYTTGKDIFEAFDRFEEKFQEKKVKRACFFLGDAR